MSPFFKRIQILIPKMKKKEKEKEKTHFFLKYLISSSTDFFKVIPLCFRVKNEFTEVLGYVF